MSSKEFVRKLIERDIQGNECFVEEKIMYGVFKFYKHGNCNNSPYIAIFESEDVAKMAVEVLERLRLHGQKDTIFACNEGWEFGSYWTYGRVPKPMTFEEFTTHIDEVMAKTFWELTEYKPEEGE